MSVKLTQGGKLGYWKRHQKPDGQKVLEELDRMGWRIFDPPRYYAALCPCGKHQTYIHLTPNRNHFKRRLQWAKRQPCMREAEQ